MGSSPEWLNRYQNGQQDQVWQELRQLGSRIRESDWAEEAQLVCDEMARRARYNIELIVSRLSDDGYRFHTNDDDQTPVRPHIPPTAAAHAHADWLEQRFGTVLEGSRFRRQSPKWHDGLRGEMPKWVRHAGSSRQSTRPKR